MSSEEVCLVEHQNEAEYKEVCSFSRTNLDKWPLDEVDPRKARFPCCIVWTPLPIVSWLVPYIGHVGICQEDGTVLDFAGSNLVSIDNFAYGTVARYLQLDKEQCCFPRNLSQHVCGSGYRHGERGAAISWDDAINSSMHHYQHKYYNMFTCNCHSFVANCLNRLAYGGSLDWNVVNVSFLILLRGQWVGWASAIRSFLPFVIVVFMGIFMAGWPFLLALLGFAILLIAWFIFGTYLIKYLIEC